MIGPAKSSGKNDKGSTRRLSRSSSTRRHLPSPPPLPRITDSVRDDIPFEVRVSIASRSIDQKENAATVQKRASKSFSSNDASRQTSNRRHKKTERPSWMHRQSSCTDNHIYQSTTNAVQYNDSFSAYQFVPEAPKWQPSSVDENEPQLPKLEDYETHAKSQDTRKSRMSVCTDGNLGAKGMRTFYTRGKKVSRDVIRPVKLRTSHFNLTNHFRTSFPGQNDLRNVQSLCH